MILGDQKRLEVQTYTRFRIVDPLRFYQALRTLDQARAQLAQLVSSSVRRELGQVPLLALLTDQRGDIVDVIKNEVAAKARRWASKSTKCASIAPTCRSRPARRSMTA